MAITLKTPAEIDIMRIGGQKLAAILRQVVAATKVGVTTRELDTLTERLIRDAGGEPSFKGYHGYPASLCTSVNEELVHGIPSERVLEAGDIIGLDIGMRYRGFCTDMAVTVGVGEADEEAQRLLQVTQEALAVGIKTLKPGIRLGDVGSKIQSVIEGAGFGVIRDLVGHGIGRLVHEEPQIPNFGKAGRGITLQEGMVICLEPMVSLGGYQVAVQPDGWTVVTKDGSRTAHFEHTIAILSNDFEILTK